VLDFLQQYQAEKDGGAYCREKLREAGNVEEERACLKAFISKRAELLGTVRVPRSPLLGFVAGSSPSPSSSSSADASEPKRDLGICFKKGEVVSGFNKVCSYSCGLSTAAVTVGSFEMCPFNP